MKVKTGYTFEIKGTVVINVDGANTDENYQKAMIEAVKQAKKDIDEDWIADVDAKEFEGEEE